MWRQVRIVTAIGILGLAIHCGTGDPSTPAGPAPAIETENSPDASPGPAWGLDSLAANTTCVAPPRPPTIATGAITAVPAFPNLDTQNEAIALERRRLVANEPLRWFVAQRSGKVYTFVDSKASKSGLAVDNTTPVEKAELFFETHVPISVTNEGGLLAFAFDPDVGIVPGAADVYVHFVNGTRNELWRYRVVREAGAFVRKSETLIWQNESSSPIHYGGAIAFGPDRNLYIGIGDGGKANMSALPQRVRGKVLRIAPLGQATYAIPDDNPFRLSNPDDPKSVPNAHCSFASHDDYLARVEPCPEVYALGFRNPWRITFDRATGALWVGDVGETKAEEIDRVERGRNYGWYPCEGTYPTMPENFCPPANAGTGLTTPVAQFRGVGAQAVAGGFVYRGRALGKEMYGTYIFGETYGGEMYAINDADAVAASGKVLEHPDATNVDPLSPRFRKLGFTIPLVAAFAEDEDGELYALTLNSGFATGVMKIVPTTTPPQDTIPKRLSLTGCVDPNDTRKLAAGVLPYDVIAPFWSDDARKERFLAMPPGTRLTADQDGHFGVPIGAVMMKHFVTAAGKRIETRLLVRHIDGGYGGYSYVWRDDGLDADLANPSGERRLVADTSWTFPSRAQCFSCHSSAAGWTLGLQARQLQADFDYPGGRRGNQLETLRHLGLLEEPFEPKAWTALERPGGNGDLDARARAYLHANCSMCHRDQSGGLDLRVNAASTRLCDPAPWLVPGDPGASRLLALLGNPDPRARMPRTTSEKIDTAGIDLVTAWIASRGTCP